MELSIVARLRELLLEPWRERGGGLDESTSGGGLNGFIIGEHDDGDDEGEGEE